MDVLDSSRAGYSAVAANRAGVDGDQSLPPRRTASAALHLCRTTLVNPKPDTEVTGIDYISVMGNPGPFLVGMTVE